MNIVYKGYIVGARDIYTYIYVCNFSTPKVMVLLRLLERGYNNLDIISYVVITNMYIK